MNSFLTTLKHLGPARLAIMGGITLLLLGFFIFVTMRVSSPSLDLLYADLSSTDASAVAAKLEEIKISYQVSPDGSKVLVPRNEVGRARMLLAKDGLPNGGSLGYEIFDRQNGFGTTNFIQNINQVRALEGELARTISSLGPVRGARVHLVLPQRELFSREERASSASVFLQLRPSSRLSPEQIVAIQSLVSSAVQNLKADNVAVIDSSGALLARGGGENAESLSGVKSEEMRRSYESRLAGSIEDIVSRTVGFGKVRANVAAELNFDRITTNEELFDPEGQVVRSSQTVNENNKEREPNNNSDVGVSNNLPLEGGSSLVLNEAATNEGNRTEETTNFEVSKTVRSTLREVGEVKRISVAVLVDGNYTTDDKGVKTYQPRPQAELDKIAQLVRSAIGFNEQRGDKVEVVNLQFADVAIDETTSADKILGFEKSDLLSAAEVITVAIMIILVVLLVLQPMVGRLLASTGPVTDDSMMGPDLLPSPRAMSMTPQIAGPMQDAMQQLAPPQTAEEAMIDMQKVEGKVKASSVKKVEDIVNSYPGETVSVLRGWMTQE